jgi:hypothetical protein
MKAVRFGMRILGHYLIFVVVSLILLFMVLGTPALIRIPIMLALIAGFGLIMLNDGGYIGEKAVTMQKLIEKRRAEGHAVDPANERAAFHKKKALTAYAVAVAPLLLAALINIAYQPVYDGQLRAYEEKYGPIEAFDVPAATAELENGNLVYIADEQGGAMAEGPQAPVNAVSVGARILFAPFIAFLIGLEDRLGAYNALLAAFAFVVPAFGAIGYLNGPKLYQKKLSAIEKGVRRKKRMAKLQRANGRPKGPKPEV